MAVIDGFGINSSIHMVSKPLGNLRNMIDRTRRGDSVINMRVSKLNCTYIGVTGGCLAYWLGAVRVVLRGSCESVASGRVISLVVTKGRRTVLCLLCSECRGSLGFCT